MPFLIVSEEEYKKEVSKLEKPNSSNEEIVSDLEITTIERGRGNTPEVPDCLRGVIAEDKILGMSAQDITKAYGISPSSINAYAHGATSTASYHRPTEELNKVRTRIAKRASNRLNSALIALGEKDLKEEKAKDISAIAKDMAVVFDKVSPVKAQENENGNKHLHLHMYAPKMKQVSDYEIIDVVAKSE